MKVLYTYRFDECIHKADGIRLANQKNLIRNINNLSLIIEARWPEYKFEQVKQRLYRLNRDGLKYEIANQKEINRLIDKVCEVLAIERVELERAMY